MRACFKASKNPGHMTWVFVFYWFGRRYWGCLCGGFFLVVCLFSALLGASGVMVCRRRVLST